MIAERLSARRALGQCKNVTLFYACAQGRDASPSKHPMAHSKKVYDAHLSTLCWRSRVAFRQWKAAGSPRSGPLYDERKACKKYVRPFPLPSPLLKSWLGKVFDAIVNLEAIPSQFKMGIIVPIYKG